ncbi:DUF5067 domain-containing protein [Peptoniphilus sp. AGMB00490]|uniref:DUF5067 domain-containing protein n=1 Tax=Peptoniphilus faecalis TaxID=2731255 RepID=A0A848R8W3_9FIRM|nr:DUF5067 domain-containing protein [Peptoniphilus faecalis]NMW84258.1 DUF5067 domain-containing protein [Peptoniphilus faecalis]
MKKNVKNVLAIGSIALLLTACGGKTNEVKNEPPKENKTNAVESVESKQESSKESNIFEDESAKVIIKNYEFLKSQYDENVDIVALTIEFTNKTDEAVDPWFGTPLKGEQETDKTIELLDGANGLFPEDYKPDLVAASDVQVKPGATVEAVIGYQLKIKDSPVYVRDWDGNFEYVLNK